MQMSVKLEQSEDHRLVLRCLNQESDAFEILVKRHQVRLFHIAMRILHDREQSADTVQETFLRAYRKLAEYRPTGSFAGWLARIAVNLCLNELSRRKRLQFPSLSLADWLPAGPDSDPERAAQASDLRAVVRAQMDRLSPGRKAVLALAALGYSYDEMCEILEWKMSQVKSELFRARQTLRDRVAAAKGDRS
ncbi:MAG: sigma-70 family RNA polymerase sigma factor [Armatimonadetes bacterium]|nr:sigma-70 family RNA polymerase sigma factor [Armatimonadota bacterium]